MPSSTDNCKPPLDHFGRTIEVGDRVVWPGRQSSSLWMSDGTVIAIEYRESFFDDKLRPRVYVEKTQTNWKHEKVGTRKTFIDVVRRVVIVEKGQKEAA